MDGEQLAPEASREVSSSPGSSSPSSSSAYASSPRDSETEVSIKKFAENSKISSSSSSSEDEDDENGEVVSGVEEFVEEPPVPAGGLKQGDDSDAPFLDSAGISIPIARASTIDSDDDDDIVGGSKEEGEQEEGGSVLKDSSASGDDSDKGLKIFGVSGSVESAGIGEVGVEGTPKPVVVVNRLSENGGIGEFLKESGVGDTSQRTDGVLLGGELGKVLEIPRSGPVEALVSDESNVPEGEEGTQMKEEVRTGSPASLGVKEKGEVVEEGASLGSGVDEVEPVIVEPVNEKLGSVTEESDVPKKVEGEGAKVKDEVAVEEGKIDAYAGDEPAAGLEVKEKAEVLNEDNTLDNAVGEVEPVIVEPVTEKLGEPDGVELASKGDSVVEAIHVNLLASGAAVVGDAEENKQSDMTEEDSLVGRPINVDNVFDRISPDAEEPEKIVDLSMGKIPENTEVEVNDSNGLETDATSTGKGKFSESIIAEILKPTFVKSNGEVDGSMKTGNDENKSAVEEEKNDVLAGDELTSVLEVKEKGEMVEEGATLGSGTDKVEPVIGSVIVEPVNENSGEQDVMELGGKGDSVVEAIHVNLLTSGTAVIGDVEENKLSEIKEKDSLVSTPVNVDNVFDRISPDIEEPEKIAELSMGKIAENTEVEVNDSNGPETDGTSMGKGNEENKSDVEEEKSDVLAGDEVASVFEVKEKREMVEEGTTLGSGIDKVEPVIIEPVNENLGEQDVMELGGKGDSVVEAINVNLLASGAAVIGDVEENKLSEIKEKDSLVGTSVSVDNVFDQISTDAEEPEKVAEVAIDKIPETTEVELNKSNGLETDATSAGKGNDTEPLSGEVFKSDGENDNGFIKTGDHQDMSFVVEVATKDVQNFQKIEASDDENTTVDLSAEQRPAMEVAAVADSDTKQNEQAVGAIAEKELISINKVGGGDGDGTKVQNYAEPMNTDAMDSAKPTEDDHITLSAQGEQLEGKVNAPETLEMTSPSNSRARLESKEEEMGYPDEDGEIEDSITNEENESVIFGNSEAAKQFLEGLERRSAIDSNSGAESSHDHSRRIDGEIATDSDEEADTDVEEDGKELFDSAALTALLKAATGTESDGGNITITSKDGSKLFSVERPAGLGSSLRPMKPPASWSNRSNVFNPSTLLTGAETESSLSDEEKQKLEKLQQIRVKFLRLVQRLGHSPEDQTAAQVLYRLALVAGRQTNQLFSLDDAKRTAFQLEEEGKDDLNFSLNILVLGKTGVGKSSTINSIFGEEKSQINAFEYATNAVKEISGTVDGVKIRVFDTPGLKSSVFEQGYNKKVLSSVKRFTKKCPPDIVLYVDRMDTQTRDLNDLPMLKTITSTLGPSIWRSAIVTLTHAASAPPDGPTGNPLSYEVFVAQRSHIVQQSIGQAVGDLRMLNPSSMNPVSLVENHPSCRKNREGLKVLPNGQSWKPHLLFLCYSMKILSEASSVSKSQDPVDHRKLFGFRARSPPLPYLLSWLLQSRTHPKLLTDQGRNDVDSDVFDDDVDLEGEGDEEEDEDEYDQLPPFRPLTKEQLKKLTKEQRNAYFDEYEYRVKLLQKKQWKEMKKGNVGTDDMGNGEGEEGEADNGNDGMVQVPLPDMVLPHSFDGDSPAYRYRFLDPQTQLLTRPVLDTHGWDHDCGYDGVNIEHRALAIKNKYPGSVAVQITKDKKEFNIHLDSSISAKHGEKGSSMIGFDIQNVGKQLAYIVRAESKFKNLERNKTTAGASVTFLGENVATGIKVEDQVALGKRLMLTGSTGTVRSGSDAAYGANLEVQLREADYPIGQDQSSLGLSLVKWRGDLALGANFQSQVSVGRGSKVTIRAGLNNKRSGQISIALNSTEQLQLALVGIIPLARAIHKALSPGASGGNSYSMY